MKLFFLLLVALAANVAAQTGELIPLPAERADENVLALAGVEAAVRVDNQSMTVRLIQIFENRTAAPLEAKYVYALPAGAAVTDFAIWDDAVRVPGVMMERRRAAGIYASIRDARRDPGLLQADDDASGRSVFTARVFPIPAYGTKRVEIEYREELAIFGRASRFVLPLRASSPKPTTAGSFALRVEIVSETPLGAVDFDVAKFPLTIENQDANRFAARFDATDFPLDRDFELAYDLAAPESLLSFIAYRAPESVSAYELRNPALAARSADGYFELRALGPAPEARPRPPRRVMVALDTSLSMAGDKLARAYETAELVLRALTPDDEFDLLLFADDTRGFRDAPVAATPDNIAAALAFIRASTLGGGTNLKTAFAAAIAGRANRFSDGVVHVVAITDADATLETLDRRSILDAARNDRVRFLTVAVGGDADRTLTGELASRTGGSAFTIRETDDAAPVAALVNAAIAEDSARDAAFSANDPANIYAVYPAPTSDSAGESHAFVGRYRAPGRASLAIAGEGLSLSGDFELPEFAADHAHLPRLWARARIDSLLRRIDLDGETDDAVNEIVALSQKYKIASPYTAFIAAPRALLRPRLIQPGDPVIRVRTDASVTRVFAVLPFGETLPLRFFKDENVWETRFLAPAWMTDGQYSCRLLLTDKSGAVVEEQKTFIVDSRAPEPKIELAGRRFFAGAEILVRVASDRDTAALTATFPGAAPVRLRWSDAEKTNVGVVAIPAATAPGSYRLSVAAEDFAHNQSVAVAEVEVAGQ